MTAFHELPETSMAGVRWVGSSLMDEEQFHVEGWHLDRGEWRARLDGLRRYAQLRRDRRAERKEAWQAREAEDSSFRDYVDNLADQRPAYRNRRDEK